MTVVEVRSYSPGTGATSQESETCSVRREATGRSRGSAARAPDCETTRAGTRRSLDVLAFDAASRPRVSRSLFVERLHHRAFVVDALATPRQSARAAPAAAAGRCDRMLDDVLRLARPAAIGAACNQQRVLEAGRGDEAGARALAREDRVVDDGRAVQEQPCLGSSASSSRPMPVGSDAHRIDHAVCEIRRRGKRLADPNRIPERKTTQSVQVPPTSTATT